MTLLLIAVAEQFSGPAYCAACKKAVDINDPEKVSFLLAQAADHVPDLPLSFHGEIARYAYRDQAWIAHEIVEGCSPEQIAAAPPDLLAYSIRLNDHSTAWKLAEGGINVDDCFAAIAAICKAKGGQRMAVDLLRQGARVSPDNFLALHACIQSECTELGQFLLDQGMDLDQYKEWAVSQRYGLRCNDTLASLEEHWNELQAQVQEKEPETADPQMGGMNLG